MPRCWSPNPVAIAWYPIDFPVKHPQDRKALHQGRI